MRPSTLFFYPFEMQANAYPRLQREILSRIATHIEPINAARLLRNIPRRARSVAVINFFEDRTAYHRDRPNRTLLQNLATLLLLKLACKRLVWVRHNYWPHDLPRPYLRQTLLLAAIGRLASVTVTHRAVAALSSVVAPHPAYFENPLPPIVRDIPFLCVGAIKRYKGLNELLEVWPQEYPLTIAGAAPDPEILAQLHATIAARSLRVELLPSYLSDAELEALLLRTKYCVQAHADDSMIVSGGFYHAASLGANVLAKRSEFATFAARQFDFVTLFEADSLVQTLATLRYVEPDAVAAQTRRVNGVEATSAAWRTILEAG